MHSIVRQKLTIGLKKKYSSLHHYRVVTVADTEGEQGAIPPPLEAHVRTLPSQKSVESKAGKRDLKNT